MPWMEKTFQKDLLKATRVFPPGHKVSVVPRPKLLTQGRQGVEEPKTPGLVIPCLSWALS